MNSTSLIAIKTTRRPGAPKAAHLPVHGIKETGDESAAHRAAAAGGGKLGHGSGLGGGSGLGRGWADIGGGVIRDAQHRPQQRVELAHRFNARAGGFGGPDFPQRGEWHARLSRQRHELRIGQRRQQPGQIRPRRNKRLHSQMLPHAETQGNHIRKYRRSNISGKGRRYLNGATRRRSHGRSRRQ